MSVAICREEMKKLLFEEVDRHVGPERKREFFDQGQFTGHVNRFDPISPHCLIDMVSLINAFNEADVYIRTWKENNPL